MPRTNSQLQEATSRDFSGGLNVADSELNLSSKYAVVLKNMVVGIDGSLDVRQGNKLFCDIASVSDYNIIDGRYFFRRLVVINERGELISVDGTGVATSIWNPAIAAALRPGLTIWPSASGVGTGIGFAEFNGRLIVGSKTNKPLEVTTSYSVDYLADPATGSNVNVPVGSILCAHDQHLCIADGYLLNVSERGAGGVWPGDPGATFTNVFDMRRYVTIGDTEIIGAYSFKNFLLVCFREVIVPVQFVEDATATPKLNITVPEDSIIVNYGAISQRTAQDVGNQILSADIVGVQAQALGAFTKILSPDRPSRFVDPILQPAINKLSDVTMRTHIFSVYDRRQSAYTLFVPDAVDTLRTKVTGFTYRNIDRLKIAAWSTYEGCDWASAMRSSEGNVFYVRHNSTKIFLQGDEKINPIHRDYVNEQEAWSDGTVFTDRTGWTPVSSEAFSGMPIPFDWTLPWSDLRNRALVKTLQYLILDTQGNQSFTNQVFIDDIEARASIGEAWSDGTLFDDETGWIPESESLLTPALTMQFIARDAGGYGVQPFGNSPYGSGNNTKIRQNTYMPTKFTSMKLRFFGDAWGPMKFVAITLLYRFGSIRRFP